MIDVGGRIATLASFAPQRKQRKRRSTVLRSTDPSPLKAAFALNVRADPQFLHSTFSAHLKRIRSLAVRTCLVDISPAYARENDSGTRQCRLVGFVRLRCATSSPKYESMLFSYLEV